MHLSISTSMPHQCSAMLYVSLGGAAPVICSRVAPTEARMSSLPPAANKSRRLMSIVRSSEMRVMGLMTVVTERAAGELHGDHLRKILGLGGVFFVAPPADVGDVGQYGLRPPRGRRRWRAPPAARGTLRKRRARVCRRRAPWPPRRGTSRRYPGRRTRWGVGG